MSTCPHRLDLLRHLRLDRTYVRGRGSWLWDAEGRRVLDLTSQYGAVPLGHDPAAPWAALERVRREAIPALVQPSRPYLATELARRLLAAAPLAGVADPDDGVACLAQSGSEAVEVALRVARAATGRALLVGAEGGYHGWTPGARALTRPGLLPGFATVPWDDPAALEALFRERGDEVAALVLEPLQGEGGVRAPSPGYLARARALTREHGALLVLDEVQTGLGRTGALFACARTGVQPDVLLLAKALGGGLVPLSAVLARRELVPEGLALELGSTFANNNLACAVGLTVLDALEADDGALVRRAAATGRLLRRALGSIARRYPDGVAGARGRGLLLGLELRPVGPERSFLLSNLSSRRALVALAAAWLLEVHGVRVVPAFGRHHVLRLQPPLTASDAELARGLAALEDLARLLHEGDYARLLAPFAGAVAPPPRDRRGLDRPVRAAPPAAPRERATRFAFLLHHTSPEDLVRTTPALRDLPGPARAELYRWVAARPFHAPVCFLEGVRSPAGGLADGWLIGLSHSSEAFKERPRAELAAEVQAAADTAARLGADVLGLGAFTSIATRGGRDVSFPGAVTTGNAYTVALAVDGVRHALARLGRDPAAARGLVLGLGVVGRAAAALLAEDVGEVVLVGHPGRPRRERARAERLAGRVYARAAAALGAGRPRGVAAALADLLAALGDAATGRALAERLRAAARGERPADLPAVVRRAARAAGRRAPVRLARDRRAALARADAVVAASSAPEPLIGPDDLAPGAVCCDVAKPADLAPGVAALRPDVVAFDGGLAAWPAPLAFGQNLGHPPGVQLACLTETVLLALAGATTGRFGDPRALLAEVADVRALARRHGFGLAGLRRGEGALDEAAFARARAASAAAPPLTAA